MNLLKPKLILLVAAVLVLGLVSTPVLGFAQEAQNLEDELDGQSQTLQSTGITPQGYKTTHNLKTGTVVQPHPEESDTVIPATQNKLEAAFGVVVEASRLPIQVSGSDGQVFIATSGRHTALVTSENGVIQSGDFLVVSSLSGTLMKSSPNQELIFAKALGGFDGQNNLIGTTTLKDDTGRPIKQIGIGYIQIAIEIIKNPETVSTKTNLPNWLERIGVAVAEKEVSPVRIYIGTAIIVLSIMIALVGLYVGIRTAIISIGRNPLSKKSILRGLLQVILTSILVLIIGLFTVYLLLRL